MNDSGTLKIHLPTGQKFECQMCGTCCRRWSIAIDENTYKTLKNSPLIQKLRKRYPDLEVMSYDPEKSGAFLEKVDGSCVMLEDNFCLIQQELGYQAKPAGCRSFPLIITRTPGGVFVGFSYVCPSIRENRGKPVEEYLSEIEKLAWEKDRILGEKTAVTDQLHMDWESYLELEKFLLDSIERKGAEEGGWRTLASVAWIVIERKNKKERKIYPNDLRNLLKRPLPGYLTRDSEYQSIQRQVASSLIALLESRTPVEARQNTKKILDGGSLYSDTYRCKIQVKPLDAYLDREPPMHEDPVLKSYLKHVIGRKFLLTRKNIFTGLAILHHLPVLFAWYVFAAASIQERTQPEKQDVLKALSAVEPHIHHGKFLENFIEVFCNNFLDQVEFFIETS